MELATALDSCLKELRARAASSRAFSRNLDEWIAEHTHSLAHAKAHLRRAEELSTERADLNRIFHDAGGARTHTFADLPLRGVKAILFEGLLARVLFKDDRQMFFEFNDQDHLTRSMLEWSGAEKPPASSAAESSS